MLVWIELDEAKNAWVALVLDTPVWLVMELRGMLAMIALTMELKNA